MTKPFHSVLYQKQTFQSSFTALGLRVSLALCRQLLKISSLLLRVASSSWKRMTHFSRRQRRHCLVEGL